MTVEQKYLVSGEIPEDIQCDENDIRSALEDVFENVSSVEIEDGVFFADVSATASYIYHPATWGRYGGNPEDYELQRDPYNRKDLDTALSFAKRIKVEEWN